MPSLLGREFFRTRVTSYHVHTFADAAIFVLDVERSLELLSEFDRAIIGMVTLQEYTHEEAAQILGCGRRTVSRGYPDALDRVTTNFLQRSIIARLPESGAGVCKGKRERNESKSFKSRQIKLCKVGTLLLCYLLL